MTVTSLCQTLASTVREVVNLLTTAWLLLVNNHHHEKQAFRCLLFYPVLGERPLDLRGFMTDLANRSVAASFDGVFDTVK